MRDRVGIVAQQGLLARIGAVEAAVFLDQMAQEEHAQAHLERIILVGARDVDMRAAGWGLMSPTCAFSSSAESGFTAPSITVATSETGSAGTTSPTFSISSAPSRSISAKRRCSSR